MEAKLLEGVKQMVGKGVVEVSVNDRRLKVGAHNQWKFVNGAQLRNSIALSLEGSILQCNGILIVDSIYMCKGMALVFQLEYSIKVLMEFHKEEIKTVILSEYVRKLDYSDVRNEYEPIEIVEEMSLEMDNSITGNSLWVFSEGLQDDDWKIMIHCEVSPKQGKAAIEKAKEMLESFAENKKFAEMRAKQFKEAQEKEAEFREKERILREKEDNMLKKELENERAKKHIEEKGVKNVKDQIAPIIKEKTLIEQIESITPQRTFKDTDIDEDMRDPLKAHSIIFEFLSFNPQAFLLDDPKKILTTLCFSFKFYDFPVSYTPSVILRSPQTGSKSNLRLLQLSSEVSRWTNLSSRDEKKRQLKLVYDFDPSLDLDMTIDHQLEEFLKYLVISDMKIWVWNADCLIPLGCCKVSLSELLRKGKEMRSLEREYDVFNEEKAKIGVLQLKLQNAGKKVEERKKEKPKYETVSGKGKTKIRSKPLTAQELAKTSEIAKVTLKSGQNEAERKNEIVNNYILYTTSKGNNINKDYLQGEIEKHRIMSRTMNLSHITTKPVDLSADITYSIGQALIYSFQVINTEPIETPYAVVISDPDGENTIQLITDPEEWKFYCSRENICPPSEWNKFIGGTDFFLHAKEEIILLFKILALNPPAKQQRAFTLSIKNLNNDKILTSKNTVIKYKDTFYNSYTIFTVPENNVVDIPLQSEIPSSISDYPKSVLCNNPQVSARLNENRLLVNFASPKSPTDTELLFFLFADEYKYTTLSILYAIVRSYSCVDVNQIAGIHAFIISNLIVL